MSLLLALVLLEHEVWWHSLTIVGLYAYALITALQTVVSLRNRTRVSILCIMIWWDLSDTMSHITVLHLAHQANGRVDVAGVGWRILDQHVVKLGHRRRSVRFCKVNLLVCLGRAWVFSQYVILRCYYQGCYFVVFDMRWDIGCLNSVEGWLRVLVPGWWLLSQHGVTILACINRNWLRLLFAWVIIVALETNERDL